MSNGDREAIIRANSFAGQEELQAYQQLVQLMRSCPIGEREILANLGLFANRTSMSRLLFLHNLYLRALNTHGVAMEFGVRWGQNLSLLVNFRNIYEPYNMSRKIVGFDTFEGLTGVSAADGSSPTAAPGALSVTPGYERYLSEVLAAQEQLGPRSHIRRFEIVKGDVTQTLPEYLKRHPETIIAFAFFDLVLFEPTKKVLELIRPHLAKNSVIGFDQLGLGEYPGETQALKEAWGVGNYRIIRDPISSMQSYLIFE
jgi:hypothetical protein